jgi:hypothetical protein
MGHPAALRVYDSQVSESRPGAPNHLPNYGVSFKETLWLFFDFRPTKL